VRAAGVRRFGGVVEVLELPRPRRLRPDEVMIDVRVCGVGNWDEFARTGNWDLGIRPPMALGVEAAGLVAAVGDQVAGIAPDGRRLGTLVRLFAEGLLTVSVADRFPLERAGAALACARHGAHGSATVLRTGAADPKRGVRETRDASRRCETARAGAPRRRCQ
jgi:hypothetical protein